MTDDYTAARIRRQRDVDDALRFDSIRQRLFTASKDDKARVAADIDEAMAQRILDYLACVPGDDPDAREALYAKYPHLNATQGG